MRKNREEEINQVTFVSWFRVQYPRYRELLTFASFGENIGPKRMARLKQMGLTPGYPDLMLFVPKPYQVFWRAGLLIEMKRKKGRPTPNQLHIHELLTEKGYVVKVAHSWEEAKEIMLDYLES